MSTTTAIAQEVESVVNGFVNENYMFTAYDVTLSVRKAGHKANHKDVRAEVEDMFFNGDMDNYSRTLVNVGAPVAPQVYHENSLDPDEYDKDWLDTGTQDNTVVSTTAPAVPASVAPAVPVVPSVGTATTATTPTTPTTATQKVDVYLPEKDGRLNIPSRLIGRIGAKSGDMLHVYRGPRVDTIIVSHSSIPNSFGYCVDKDNRIRVSKNVRIKLGLNEDEFSITGGCNAIVISAA